MPEAKFDNLGKKGQGNVGNNLSGIFASIPQTLTLIVVAAIIGMVAVLTLTGMDDSLGSDSLTNTNESVTFTATAGTLGVTSRVTTTGTTVNNFTNNTIGTNNYIVNTNGSVNLRAGMSATGAQGTAPTLNFTYSFLDDTSAEEILGNATTGIANIFNQFGTVGTVIGVMFILGAVLFFLGRARRDKGAL